MDKKALMLENSQLRSIIKDTLWMARRYADKRSSYSTSQVNEALELAKILDVGPGSDVTLEDPDYAIDGMFGYWNGLNFQKEKPERLLNANSSDQ